MKVKKVIYDYLKENNFDGLYFPGECACLLDDLAPCGDLLEDCEAGYLRPCNCGEHDWHIGPRATQEGGKKKVSQIIEGGYHEPTGH